MNKFVLDMDEYEATNLFWLLSLVYKSDLPVFRMAILVIGQDSFIGSFRINSHGCIIVRM